VGPRSPESRQKILGEALSANDGRHDLSLTPSLFATGFLELELLRGCGGGRKKNGENGEKMLDHGNHPVAAEIEPRARLGGLMWILYGECNITGTGPGKRLHIFAEQNHAAARFPNRARLT